MAFTCHGDDFMTLGVLTNLKWITKVLEGPFEVNAQKLSPEEERECVQEIRILNRTIRWTRGGIEYEADPRHAQQVVEDLELQLSKGVSTPGVTEDEENSEKQEKESWQTDALYRAVAARINYLSIDRPGLQFSCKNVAQCMAQPTIQGWTKLKRMGKYLLKFPILIQLFQFGKDTGKINADGDSDWAGDKASRNSTSGGSLRLGVHVMKTWSSTQQTISLSSAEVELYAMSKAVAQAIGLMQLLREFGRESSIVVQSDSSVAIATVK